MSDVKIVKLQWLFKSGVSNLFHRRAKCTNFKLVGVQTTEAPKVLGTPKASRGKGMGRGYSPPQPTRGLRERCELSQRGPGRSPSRKRVLVYFRAWKKTHLIETSFLTFLQHIFTTNKGVYQILTKLGRPCGTDRNAWRAGLWPAGRMLDTRGLNGLAPVCLFELCVLATQRWSIYIISGSLSIQLAVLIVRSSTYATHSFVVSELTVWINFTVLVASSIKSFNQPAACVTLFPLEGIILKQQS